MGPRVFRKLPVPALLGLLLVLSFGCGGGQPAQEETEAVAELQDESSQPEVEPTPEPTVEELVNFASIEQFPTLSYSASEDLSPSGHLQVPLIENNNLEQGMEEPIATFWAATIPATYEISLPPKAVLERIEVQTTGGTTAFEECVVFVRQGAEDWKRPQKLSLLKSFAGTDDDGDMTRFVFRFQETPATDVLLGFARGCERIPDQVRVHDIDILGHHVP